MNRILKSTKNFIFSKQSSIFSSAMIISAMIICSRFFGFFRYRILVGYFTKEELDIFFAAFRIPDLIFEVLITGALTSAFIPIFIKYQKDKKELYANISSIINVISVALYFCYCDAFIGKLDSANHYAWFHRAEACCRHFLFKDSTCRAASLYDFCKLPDGHRTSQ